MKLIPVLICTCAVLYSTNLSAQVSSVSPAPSSAPMVDPPKPAMPTRPPADPTIPDGDKYTRSKTKLDGCKAQVAAFKDKQCDILFIGDSITSGWLGKGKAVWDKSYANRNAMDFGVSGDTTQNVLWRMDNMGIDKLKPKVSVIMIGTNNTANSPEQITAGVKAVITKTETMFPMSKIILVSITPNQRAGEKMTAVDAVIKDFADNKTVFFLDLVPLMPPVTMTKPDGKVINNWKGMSPDQLHPDASGYQIWADAMEPLLTKLLAP